MGTPTVTQLVVDAATLTRYTPHDLYALAPDDGQGITIVVPYTAFEAAQTGTSVTGKRRDHASDHARAILSAWLPYLAPYPSQAAATRNTSPHRILLGNPPSGKLDQVTAIINTASDQSGPVGILATSPLIRGAIGRTSHATTLVDQPPPVPGHTTPPVIALSSEQCGQIVGALDTINGTNTTLTADFVTERTALDQVLGDQWAAQGLAATTIAHMYLDGQPTDHWIVRQAPKRPDEPAHYWWAKRLMNRRAMNITPQYNTQAAALHCLNQPARTLPAVLLEGPAGTGKTLLAVAEGVAQVRAGEYEAVEIYRPLNTFSGDDTQNPGYLPGSLDEKMAGYTETIHDALRVIARAEYAASTASELVEPSRVAADAAHLFKEYVTVSPITYLRGRTLTNRYVIIEEAQNFTMRQLFHLLTRAGEGTKMVFTFDPDQVDNQALPSGQYAEVVAFRSRISNEPLVAHIVFDRTVRSKIASLGAAHLAAI